MYFFLLGYGANRYLHVLTHSFPTRRSSVLPDEPIWSFAALPSALPAGTYRLDHGLKAAAASRAALGWCLGSYAFTRYKETARNFSRLVRSEERRVGERVWQ